MQSLTNQSVCISLITGAIILRKIIGHLKKLNCNVVGTVICMVLLPNKQITISG